MKGFLVVTRVSAMRADDKPASKKEQRLTNPKTFYQKNHEYLAKDSTKQVFIKRQAENATS